jgi:transcriptional regulator with XRE-family HTH domain
MIARLDEIARSQKLSRNKLLLEVGLKSYADNLAKGRLPNVGTVNKLADYLDCSVDYLLGRTDKPDVNK